ncbi:MAG: efflux RND transporter permease subunit, partial [Gemmatimonadetes bacterium]|nr:efflux RND transporter permease subunit [Gemmatimonadota bacterium]
MLNQLIAWSLRNRVLVLAITGLMLVGGAWIAYRMPVDVFPDLTAPTVTILAEAHGMAPEEI